MSGTDPWEEMRRARESEQDARRGEHADAPKMIDRVPLKKLFSVWIRKTVPEWFQRQLPDQSKVPHSPYYVSVSVTTSIRKTDEGSRRRTSIPLIIAGRRVSRWALLAAVVVGFALLRVLV